MVSLAAIVSEPTEAPEGLEGAGVPQVFVRTFTTPAGMPWDQGRAAQLEARHGAPLPIVDLLHRVRRLEGWAPGQLGQFAAFYVRRKDVVQPFETTHDVDGKQVHVAFGGRTDPLRGVRQAGGTLVTVLTVALPVLIAAGFLSLAWSVRSDVTQQLDRLEIRVAAKSRLAAQARAEDRQSQTFVAEEGHAGQVADLVSDLTWLANARKADARILSIHWDHGLMAVEAHGSAQPLDPGVRRIVRAAQPTPNGTWLWGISRAVAPARGGR